MRILLTGATGYLGSKLAHRFLENGHTVLCIVRESASLTKLKDILGDISIGYVNHQNLSEIIVAFSPDVAVHTACLYERQEYAPVVNANLLFPLKILKICIDCSVKKWINTDSSLPIYLNNYALTKHQFSQWGRFHANKADITFVNLRLEHFYGEEEPENHFLPWVVGKLKKGEQVDLTAGVQQRDFVYIGDLLDIYSRLVEMVFEGFVEIPIGTGDNPSIREIIEYLYSILKSNSKLCFGAIPMREGEPNSNCDTSMLDSLNLTCKWSWKKGMKKIWGSDVI